MDYPYNQTPGMPMSMSMPMGSGQPGQMPLALMAAPSMQAMMMKPTSTSPAQLLLKHKPKPHIEGIKKVYVGRLPRGVKDEFIERILKVASWRRMSDDNGESKTFGICEFEDAESLLRCWRLLNGMTLLGSQLMIKIDSKSQEFLEEWREYKKSEWMDKQKKKGVEIDLEDFYNRERSGEIMDWEKDIIGEKETVFAQISEIIKNKDMIEEASVKTENYISSLTRDIEASLKENPRERDRDKRRKFRESEREKQFKKLLDEVKEREKSREQEKVREKEREAERQHNKQKLIDKDMAYDPVAEKKKKKKDPEYYKHQQEERKKYREREREEDDIERKKEEEGKVQEELKRVQTEEEARKKKEWESRAAFTQVEESKALLTTMEISAAAAPTLEQPMQMQGLQSETKLEPMVMGSAYATEPRAGPETTRATSMQFKETPAEEDNPNKKQPVEMPKLEASTVQAMDKIAAETKAQSREEEEERNKTQRIMDKIDNDEETKHKVELAKQIYSKIPSRKVDLFKFPINWEVMEKHSVLEKKLRPWVMKRIKEYLGTEEESVTNLIMKKVKKKCPPQEIEDATGTFLLSEAEGFVMKMWKILVFEQLKAENSIIAA